MRLKLMSYVLAVLVAAGFASSAQATPGFIALEGSDATAFHQDPGYSPLFFQYLQGGSSLPVLVYSPTGTVNIVNPGTATLAYTTSLAAITLSDYSALYIESATGCCAANPTDLDGFGASVSAFIAAGGNLSIENYIGGGYDGVVPGGALAGFGFGNVQGFPGSSPVCTDGERVNANGIGRGFAQPQIDRCWSHQGYQNSYFLPLGYISLFDSSTDATAGASDFPGAPGFTFGDGTQIGSSLLAFGGVLGTPTGTGVPEPSTIALMAMALLSIFGFGMMRRRHV